MKKNKTQDLLFVKGLTCGFILYVLAKSDNEEIIVECFENVIRHFDYLDVGNMYLFPIFRETLEQGAIQISDIDKLMIALINHDCDKGNIAWLAQNFELMKREIV